MFQVLKNQIPNLVLLNTDQPVNQVALIAEPAHTGVTVKRRWKK
jgi:hypothetical protein